VTGSGATLRRSIGLPLLTLYGMGTILGAGIYVLVGEVAAVAGYSTPLAFVIACLVASLTGLSYAELSSSLPKSAGEAAYVNAAFSRNAIAHAVGASVILTGVVSAATMLRGLVGYLSVFATLPDAVVVGAGAVILLALAAWGIGQALWAAAIVTIIEAAGLIYICIVANTGAEAFTVTLHRMATLEGSAGIAGIVAGSFLAFYAFIGFEDIVNVAEEVKRPEKNLPRAIVLSLVAATLIYFTVSTVAVMSVAPAELAATQAPLAVVAASGGHPDEPIAVISLLAVTNGALIQIIMASRVLYGMADQGLIWHAFARVNAYTRTPLVATTTIGIAILILALFFSVGELARFTSALALLIFAMVNLALLRLKRRADHNPRFEVPGIIPGLALLACLVMLVQDQYSRFF
jgi:APA family basic amino acid/polyamine antiporter